MEELSTETVPFLIEAAVLILFAVLLLGFCVRQLAYDYAQEKWRPLVFCHVLTTLAIVCQTIWCIDPQCVLGVFDRWSIRFLQHLRVCIIVVAAHTLAASFLASHKLVTQGQPDKFLYSFHITMLLLGFLLGVTLIVTKEPLVNVAAYAMSGIYCVFAGTQVICSASKVRNILREEHERTGNYAEAIRKLNLLIGLIVPSMLFANASYILGIVAGLKMGHVTSSSSFNYLHLVDDAAGFFAPVALLVGSHTSSNNKRRLSKRPPPPSSLRPSVVKEAVRHEAIHDHDGEVQGEEMVPADTS